MKKTSQKWYDELNEFLKSKDEKSYFIIYDPDGWDRTNYGHSFNEEEITKGEFINRTFSSTVIMHCSHELMGEWENITT